MKNLPQCSQLYCIYRIVSALVFYLIMLYVSLSNYVPLKDVNKKKIKKKKKKEKKIIHVVWPPAQWVLRATRSTVHRQATKSIY